MKLSFEICAELEGPLNEVIERLQLLDKQYPGAVLEFDDDEILQVVTEKETLTPEQEDEVRELFNGICVQGEVNGISYSFDISAWPLEAYSSTPGVCHVKATLAHDLFQQGRRHNGRSSAIDFTSQFKNYRLYEETPEYKEFIQRVEGCNAFSKEALNEFVKTLSPY